MKWILLELAKTSEPLVTPATPSDQAARSLNRRRTSSGNVAQDIDGEGAAGDGQGAALQASAGDNAISGVNVAETTGD